MAARGSGFIEEISSRTGNSFCLHCKSLFNTRIGPEQDTYTFHCSEVTGGACDPNYLYQWQLSENRMNWADIEGAVGKNLQFSKAVLVSTYFRRVTIEARSN